MHLTSDSIRNLFSLLYVCVNKHNERQRVTSFKTYSDSVTGSFEIIIYMSLRFCRNV